MPHTITLDDARSLLRTREQVLADGLTERDIRALIDAGALKRVRRGWYVTTQEWEGLWSEGRHLLQIVALHLSSASPGPVFVGVSAAVLHGLPLYRHAPRHLHVHLPGASHSHLRFGVAHHHVGLAAEDVEEIGGIRCSSLDRTILDVACSLPEEAALSCADAALREIAVVGQVQDADRAERWRFGLGQRAERLHVRGVRRARRIIAFADGRAQRPGESVSRLQLSRLGFTRYELQVPVVADGKQYWMDFAFPGARRFGEFDGRGKYLDDGLRGELTADDVVMAEKAREDAVRGVTGWGFARWGSEHIVTAELLGARLSAFGIRPPG